MTASNKNTWLIYYALVAVGAVILMASVNNKYSELFTEKQNQQGYITKIVEADISAILLKYDTLIELINTDFVRQHKLNQAIISDVIQKSELIVGFFVFNNDATLHSKSDNLPDKNYNIKPQDHFLSWFEKAKQQDKLILSRPTYSSKLAKWIIPIQKRIVNQKGQVIGVMMSAIDLDKLEQRWSLDKTFGNSVEITLDNSYYQMLHTGTHIEDHQKVYNNPLTAHQIESTNIQLNKQGLSLEKLRNSNQIAQIFSYIGSKRVLHSITYNPSYQFWTHSSRPVNNISKQLVYTIIAYSFLYLFIMVITFFLFRWVVRTEESKLVALTYKSEHDELTGCYNRTVLESLCENLKRNNKHFSLLYIDLDNFKNINDSFGHDYGDILLQEVSKRIKKSLKFLPGYLVRYSGDEFILLLKTGNKEMVRSFTITLLNDLARFHLVHNNSFAVTSSIGITRYPDDAISLDALISYAENSMAIAKKVKNQYLFFSKEVHQQLIKKAQIEQALHNAIDNNEISLVYQPQLDIEDKLYGVEALVRWNSKELGFISPDIFIPIAEETDLMPKLGQYIMNRAMSEISSLQRELNISFTLSINVSVRQFVQVNFFELLMNSIEQHGDKNLPITIEITESLFIESMEVLKPIFAKMKSNNISLSLDDFGTGYSSLSLLREIPIDELKIDKSFVDHITNNGADEAMVKSIISIGKNLNMRVLAEGVESEQHLHILKQSGCDLFQGYYFSKPLKIKELAKFVNY